MQRILSAAFVAVGLAAAAAAALVGGPRAKAPSPAELDSVTAALDGAVRETAASVHSRATTLAELPRLAAAVSTDAATVRDLTQDELAFRPRVGEVITIGQLPKGGAPVVLLQIPEGAKAQVALDRPGARLVVDGGAASLTEVVVVVPRDRAGELSGALAVAAPIDLKPAAARLDALGVGARLEVEGVTLALGAKPLAAGADTVALPLASEAAHGAKIVVGKPPAPGGVSGRQIASGAIALVCLLLAAVLWRRKATPEAEAAAALPPSSATGPVTNVGAPSTTQAPVSGLANTDIGPGAKHIGRYVVLRQLGAGGMAEVYLARAVGEAGFEKLVALKVMHRHLAVQPVIVEHFLDEAKLASQLTHPNIVQITDLGRAGDEYFIAMEYIDGADLERLLGSVRGRGEQVPTQVALTILRKICDGLDAAHSAVGSDGKPLDIVHRDVKAANVFVARNGAVKVGDFGIAKANQVSRVNKTEAGQVKGTAQYMAPEHRFGEVVDRRADVYAVGAICWEVLTGQEVNLDLVRLIHLGQAGWPHLPKLATVRPDLPAELEAIISKALAYDREQRYPTCAALEAALEEVANKHGWVANDKAVAQWVAQVLAADEAAAPAAAGH